jgi:hypothetical protein
VAGAAGAGTRHPGPGNKRPFGAPLITIDGFVESIQIDADDKGEAFFTLQVSPADLTPYGLFAAWHTTLKTTVSSGVSSITVNNSQDNTNPLAAQLAVGTQIVLGQNTANQETVTVSAVGATSAGWTSAVLPSPRRRPRPTLPGT